MAMRSSCLDRRIGAGTNGASVSVIPAQIVMFWVSVEQRCGARRCGAGMVCLWEIGWNVLPGIRSHRCRGLGGLLCIGEKLAGIADALQMVGEFGHDVGRNATVRLPACDFGSPSISRPSSIFLG
jgi:hypothetical protein